MALPRGRSLLIQEGNENNALEIFETSCTVIMRNEGEDIPLDTFWGGKGAALAHYLKLLPYRVEVTGYLATPPKEGNILYGMGERPVLQVEHLRQMSLERTTYTYITPSYEGMVLNDLIIEEAVVTAASSAHNVYDVRLQMKNVFFYNSVLDAFQTAATAFGKIFATMAGVTVPLGAAAGMIIGATVGNALGGPAGALAGAAVGLVGGALAGALVAGTVALVVGAAAGVLNLLGIMPTMRGSLPWQKYTTPLGNYGEYEFEIYGHKDGYPVITVSKAGEILVQEAPVRMGQNILAPAQWHPAARGLYIMPIPLVEGVESVTNENFGVTTGLLAFSFQWLPHIEDIPEGVPVVNLNDYFKVK